MRRWSVPLTIALGAVAVGACGGQDPEQRFTLRTPPERAAATPLPEVRRAQRQAERDARVRLTRRDAQRLRPVLAGWGDAVRRNRVARATRYFTVPATIEQGSTETGATAAEVRTFNRQLPCGVRLLRVTHAGRFVIGTFRLTRRPGHKCTAPGDTVRVAFFVRGRKIAEWRQMADTPGAAPGPARPPGAPAPELDPVA